jgi:hypothetical protein
MGILDTICVREKDATFYAQMIWLYSAWFLKLVQVCITQPILDNSASLEVALRMYPTLCWRHKNLQSPVSETHRVSAADHRATGRLTTIEMCTKDYAAKTAVLAEYAKKKKKNYIYAS